MSSDPKSNAPHDDAEEVSKYVSSQKKVGVSLMVLVLVAVVAAFFPAGTPGLRTAALLVAVAINVFLVAGVSMHLKTEKKTITQFLIFTVIFIFVLFGLTMLAFFDSTGHHH
ncbi:MAG TPA: hypothetical protein VG733_02125 [Chthoniobacteraceae bacterium]|nr:hypothetical protein [Chthoniobacteraceae bacterium]